MPSKSMIAVYSAITAMFFLFIAGIGHLSPLNDYIFLSTLFDGHQFNGYVDRHIGRFTPLTSQEYALASHILWPSATLFYVIHAVKMALCAGLLLICLIFSRARPWLVFAMWISIFFSTGFAHSSVILQAGELNELLLTLIFIAGMLLREKNQANRTMVVGACIALIATFLYKETAFAMALAFGCVEILRSGSLKKAPKSAILLVASAIAYLAFFAVWHGFNLHGSYVSNHSVVRWQVIKGYVDNDPLIMLVLIPLTIWRFASVSIRRSKLSIFDSFLLAAFAYMAAFVVLGMYSSYYLLPTYGFATCGIAGTVASHRRVSMVFAAVATACAINSAPLALSDVIAQRNIARNYADLVRETSQWIWENPDSTPRNIVIADTSLGNVPEIFISLKLYLQWAGLSDGAYAIKAGDATQNPAQAQVFNFKDMSAYVPRVGDLVVYQPFQDRGMQPPMRSPDLRTIFRSGAEHTLPRWTAWRWFRECWPNLQACRAKIIGNIDYTGYATFLVTRASPDIERPEPVKSPSYEVGPLAFPDRARSSTDMWIDVSVKNTGFEAWPVASAPRVGFVRMSYVWLDDKGQRVLEGGRTEFPTTMLPGDIARIRMLVHTPPDRGEYTLLLSPVQEGVSWFYQADPGAPGASRHVEIFKGLLARAVDNL